MGDFGAWHLALDVHEYADDARHRPRNLHLLRIEKRDISPAHGARGGGGKSAFRSWSP